MNMNVNFMKIPERRSGCGEEYMPSRWLVLKRAELRRPAPPAGVQTSQIWQYP